MVVLHRPTAHTSTSGDVFSLSQTLLRIFIEQVPGTSSAEAYVSAHGMPTIIFETYCDLIHSFALAWMVLLGQSTRDFSTKETGSQLADLTGVRHSGRSGAAWLIPHARAQASGSNSPAVCQPRGVQGMPRCLTIRGYSKAAVTKVPRRQLETS
jgi:hypothetical protein